MYKEGEYSLPTRLGFFALVLGYFILSYFLIIKFVLAYQSVHHFYHSIDPWIPFLKGSVFIYYLVYAVPLIPVCLIKAKKDFNRMLLAFIVSLLLQEIVWILYPVEFHLRPDLSTYPNDFYILLSKWMYQLDDPPLNSFPSLHVSYAFLSYFSLKTFGIKHSNYFLLFAILISISTMTFKQHYFVDVLAGFFLAYFVQKIIYRGYERRSC